MASKSLGTLTLDLIAKIGGFTGPLDKAGRSSEKWRKQVKKDVEMAGKAVAAFAAGSAAALAAMVVATVKTAGEVSKLAAVSGVSTQEFQRYAAGASALGIEQEKLGDIFKDVSDKVGDFLQTGGGPLADFFENIAPKVGITSDAFKELSGPQALELYVSSLEKAGASQSEMVFYMEAIASDATMLLPLLKNSAEGFNLMGDAAERAGAIMDQSTIVAAQELAAATWLAEQSLTGMKNQIMTAVLPTLSDLAVELFDVAEQGDVAHSVGETLASTMKWLAAGAMGAYAAFNLAGKAIGGFITIADAATDGTDLGLADLLMPANAGRKIGAQIAKNFDQVKTAAAVVADDLDQTALMLGDKIQGILDAGSGADADPESLIKKIQAQQAAARKAIQGGGTGSLSGDREAAKRAAKEAEAAAKKTAADAARQAEAITKEISALERAAKVWGMSADEVAIYDLRIKGASESQLDYAQGLMETVTALDKQQERQEAYKDLVADLRTEEEARTDTLREQLAVITAMGDAADSEQIGRAIAAAFESPPEFAGVENMSGGALGEFAKYDDAEKELEEWYATQLEMLRQLRQEKQDANAEFDEQELILKQQHEDAMAAIERSRMLTGVQATSDFLGQLTALRDTDSKKGRQVAKTAAIAQATINAYTAATGAYASASAIPVVGWVLGPVAAAAALAAGLANVSAIKGQAHDGIMSVPSSGTWNLEKGERVTTANTSAVLDKTLADIQAGQRGSGTGRGQRSITVNQTINTTGRVDRRTSNQMATDSARKQRVAQARFA